MIYHFYEENPQTKYLNSTLTSLKVTDTANLVILRGPMERKLRRTGKRAQVLEWRLDGHWPKEVHCSLLSEGWIYDGRHPYDGGVIHHYVKKVPLKYVPWIFATKRHYLREWQHPWAPCKREMLVQGIYEQLRVKTLDGTILGEGWYLVEGEEEKSYLPPTQKLLPKGKSTE